MSLNSLVKVTLQVFGYNISMTLFGLTVTDQLLSFKLMNITN